MTMTKPPASAKVVRKLRCAVYTRKSSEEGLEQEFNSLDAQRDACEAYIKSQAHEGWKLVKEFFKAAGFTYAATIVRGKLISFAVAVTGIGYPGAVALRTVPLAGLTGERVRHPYQTD